MKELKFKAGQKVKVVSNPDPSIRPKRAMVGKVCEIKYIDESRRRLYAVWDENKSIYWWFGESDLQAINRTLDDLEVGDILVDDDGDETKVLGVLGEVIFRSRINEFGVFGIGYTVTELKDEGFKLKQEEQPEDTTELTLKEVADKFNIDVDKLRIKE